MAYSRHDASGLPAAQRDVAQSCARAAWLAVQDDCACLKLAHAQLAVPDPQGLFVLQRTHLVQSLCILYGLVDPIEAPEFEVHGSWAHLAASGVSEGVAQRAAQCLAAHASALGVCVCAALRGSLSLGERSLAHRAQSLHFQEYTLRLLRHLNSLDCPGHALQVGPLAEALCASLAPPAYVPRSRLLLTLSVVWAGLDSHPRLLETLVKAPAFLDTMRALIAHGRVDSGTAAAEAHPQEDTEIEAALSTLICDSAVGCMWGCSSRVSPSSVGALCASRVAHACADVVTAGAVQHSDTAHACAAGALAGWLAVSPEDVDLCALWAQDGVAAGARRMLDSGLAKLVGVPFAFTEVQGQREEVEPAVKAVLETAEYDWKPRDLTEAVSLLCRLLGVEATCAPAGTLPAAVAAWPLCVLLHGGRRVLTAHRLKHLVLEAPRLVPALLLLAASPCAASAALGRASLARLAAASPDAGTAAVRALSAHAAQLAFAPGEPDPDRVTLRLLPSGALVQASRRLLAARSPFFAALLGAGGAAFAPAGGTAWTATLSDADVAPTRAFVQWTATGGAAAGSVSDALQLLMLAQRWLAPDLAEAAAANARGLARRAQDLAMLLRFGHGTQGALADSLAAWAAEAAVAQGHAATLLGAGAAHGGEEELCVPQEARRAMLALTQHAGQRRAAEERAGGGEQGRRCKRRRAAKAQSSPGEPK